MSEHPDLQEVVGGIRAAVLTTTTNDGLRGRPLTVQKVDGHSVWFLVAADADWLSQLDGGVGLTWVDSSTWVSASGAASTTKDPAVLEELGDPVADAWFSGSDDDGDGHEPLALRVEVDHADWWSAPGKVRQIAHLAAAVVTQSPPDLGDRGVIE